MSVLVRIVYYFFGNSRLPFFFNLIFFIHHFRSLTDVQHMNAMFRVVTTHLAKLEVKSGFVAATEEELMLAMASEYHNSLDQTDDILNQVPPSNR